MPTRKVYFTCKMKRLLVKFCQDGKRTVTDKWLDVFFTGQKCPYLHANS